MFNADLRQLRKLIQAVKSVRTPGFKQALLKQLAETTRSEVALTFEQSQDLYGKRWKPLKAKRGRRVGGRPLLDTGRLRNSITTKVGPSSFRIGTNVPYAAVHQFGYNGKVKHKVRKQGKVDKNGVYRRGRVKGMSKKYRAGIPARPFLPVKKLPPPLARQFNKIIMSALHRQLQKR